MGRRDAIRGAISAQAGAPQSTSALHLDYASRANHGWQCWLRRKPGAIQLQVGTGGQLCASRNRWKAPSNGRSIWDGAVPKAAHKALNAALTMRAPTIPNSTTLPMVLHCSRPTWSMPAGVSIHLMR